MLQKIFTFFTNVFDSVGGWFKKLSDFFSWMATQRMFFVGAVIAAVKAVYDVTISAFNSATESMEGVNSATEVVGGLTLPDLFAFANSIIPLSETFALMVLTIEFWLACTLVKIILAFIPTIK